MRKKAGDSLKNAIQNRLDEMEAQSGRNPRKRSNPEEQEQIALFEWINLQKAKFPELALPYHVPNGGDRHILVATKLKKMGARAGVWDIYCPPTMGGLPLYIEMKHGDNDLTKSQKDFKKLIGYNARFEVCYSWQEAANVLCRFYGLELSVG